MTFARLAARDLLRSPLRLGLTVLAAAVGVLAFAFLQTVVDLWYSGVAGAQADRLVVRNKTSITQTLPLAYGRRILATPGVSAITYASWFGGVISESGRDFFPNFAVDPATYFRVFDEYDVPEGALAAFRADPCGALVGEDLARRFGWREGDRVSLKGTVYPGTWDLTIHGVYRARVAGADTRALTFGYRCVNERVPELQRDRASYFAVRVDDPARSGVVAAAIDGAFANSPNPTRSESERAFRLGFVAMSSAILTAVRAVAIVVLAILLLVVANTVAMSVRERTVELSTLRALGFRPSAVVTLILLESALIGALSAAVGLAAAPLVVRAFGRLVSTAMGAFPRPTLQPATLALSAALALIVALLAGALPALRAARLDVAEGLRRLP
ncbi:MAG: FtsX-like permease family protein [Polyangiaceae bacterium]|nr:FtsX-like permease family protein [Polyangiaceae bacterium]